MADSTVQIGVLGALEVQRAGEQAVLPGVRSRTALAALVVKAPQPLSVEGLLQAVWGDHWPARPRGAVHTVVSRLRTVLGPETVQGTPAGYRLALPVEAVDAGRFEALLKQAGGLPGEQAADVLDEALGLWRGSAYAEFAERDFATPEAARLEELRWRTVEDRARLALDAGAADDAIAVLEGLVAEQPLREHAHGLLMTALYRADRSAEALDRFHSLRRTLAEELGLDPSPALSDLHVRILGHDLPPGPNGSHAAARALPDSWRPADNAFIGREDDANGLLRLAAARRLVTITGPGGVGKTRLLAEALPGLCRKLGRPAVVVDLDDAGPGQVEARVASALGLGSTAGLRAAILEYLAASSLILTLDGCERVVEEVRPLVDAVLRAAPRVHLVATSRRRLDCPAEQVLPISPLPVPDAAEDPERALLMPAMRMFADRLRRIRPGVRLTGQALRDAGELCRRLDGLPLSMELAATQASVVGIGAVLEHLDPGLPLDDGAFGPLRAVVARSYDLLPALDRALLGRLASFAGDFDLDAVEHIAPESPAGPALARLVQASLVHLVDDGGPARYRLLGIVRTFAGHRADADASLSYWEWAADRADRCVRQATGPGCREALTGLERARTDLGEAATAAFAAGRMDLTAGILGPLGLCPHWVPGPVLSELALRLAREPRLADARGAALSMGTAGMAAVERGDLALARELGSHAQQLARTPAERYAALTVRTVAAVYAGTRTEAMALAHGILDLEGLQDAYRADAHSTLALVHAAAGSFRDAEDHAAAGRRVAEASGAEARIAFSLYANGEVLLATDPDAAADLLREAARIADGVRAAQVSAVSRVALLSVLTRTGRTAESLELALTLLELQRRAGHWPQLWTTLRILAELLVAADRPEVAQLILAAAAASPSAPGLAGPDIGRYGRLGETLDQRLGVDRAHRIAAVGRLLPRTEVLDRAREAAEGLSRGGIEPALA